MKTLEKRETINLIDGVFNRKEAKEVIYTLFSDKIKFHQNRLFHLEEKYGKVDERSKERVKVLKQNRENFIQLLDELDDFSKLFKINCNINIELVDEL